MENEKIKKINFGYLLGYVLGPIILCAICFTIGIIFFPKGTMAVILFMVPVFIAFVWWVFGGRFIFKKKRDLFEQQLDKEGFKRNQTFYADGSMIVVDVEKGKLGALFFWNPFKTYVVSLKRVSNIHVDDGRSGSGFMEGSSRVSFLFNVDDVRVRVNTFTSNQRWKMDSDYILTGISKADLMVKVLEEACHNAK